jgi:hypothetical protein
MSIGWPAIGRGQAPEERHLATRCHYATCRSSGAWLNWGALQAIDMALLAELAPAYAQGNSAENSEEPGCGQRGRCADSAARRRCKCRSNSVRPDAVSAGWPCSPSNRSTRNQAGAPQGFLDTSHTPASRSWHRFGLRSAGTALGRGSPERWAPDGPHGSSRGRWPPRPAAAASAP